jgi:hypothetical protein
VKLKDKEGNCTMTISLKNSKHIALGLAMISGLGFAAPVATTQAAFAHHTDQATYYNQYPTYYSCSKYYGDFWGYSFGYYKGSDITARLQGHDGYDGYDYGNVWYYGYYPDDEYWYFYNSQPNYVQYSKDDYQYRCFLPSYQGHQGY